MGNPLGNFDLDGHWCTAGKSWGFGKGCKSKKQKFQESLRSARSKLRSIKKSHRLTDFQLNYVDQAVRAINTTLDCVGALGLSLRACAAGYATNIANLGSVANFLSSPINSTFGVIASALGCSASSFAVMAEAIASGGNLKMAGVGTWCPRVV